jgi:glycosyltransferase involved in cell wall biosynthesis
LTKHILVVPSWYSNGRGSGGGYFRDQALALGAAGYRVAILAPDIHTWRDRRTRPIPPQPRDHARVESDGVPVYRRNDFTALPRVPYRNSLVWTRCGMKLFRRYVSDRGRPDLVHAHSCLHAGVLALAIERRYGIPFVVTEHSTGFAQSRLRWWERDLVRRVLKRAGRCIAVSPHLAELMEQQYPASSWRYLPNVLGEAFLSAAPATATHREGSLFVFLCVARMSPQKGCDLLLDAFAEAFGGDPDVRLRLVGDGPSLSSLEQLSVRLGIAAQVDFVGGLPADGVRAEMEAADAFVLASRFETFGVVVIEALACGLPVVSTASGGPDHLVDRANGLLVPQGDHGALRDALRQMRCQASRYDRVAIRADVIRQYGPDAFARQFEAIVG